MKFHAACSAMPSALNAMHERITIVGGGLAGLALGIGLRQRGVSVTLWEAGYYPRHRVCGEFISGSGQAVLVRLGLLSGLQDAGIGSAKTAAFFTEKSRSIIRALPDPALCVSRFILDEWLAREFDRLGGELRVGARWVGEYGAGIVRATGRRPEPVVEGWRLFGLKVHALDVDLDTDLEMHFLKSGYVGLCRLPQGEVNVCGLFRSNKAVPELGQRWREWLAGSPGSILHSRLAKACFVQDSFCSVAGLSLQPVRATNRPDCCVGDALTMIPPVTGNGMSLAFESAALAVDPLVKYSHGESTWQQTQRELATGCDRQFKSRLWWAAWLQRALFFPPARSLLFGLASHSETLWRVLFQQTR
jgi:2-polyprenyl-6-methoxyphenol hydroxylase-like FAD-dependent oxidoreductase